MTLLRRDFLMLAGASLPVSALCVRAGLSSTSCSLARALCPRRPNRYPRASGGSKLSEQLGQQFYVENVGGAGGNIGLGQGARAAADGHTVLVVPPNIVVNPAMYEKVPYDPYKDFEPVTVAVSAPTALSVHPSFSAASVKELVALIKAGARTIASPPREPVRHRI